MVSNAERRAITLGEDRAVPRVSDLPNMSASCRGKLELMLADDEKAEDKLIIAIIGEAVQNIAANYTDSDALETVVQQFADGNTHVEVGDDVASQDLADAMEKIEGLKPAAERVCRALERPADAANLASAAEFVLESLYVGNRLTKYAYHGRTYYKR